MPAVRLTVALIAIVSIFLATSTTMAQASREEQVVKESTEVLKEIMAINAKGIPQFMLEKAEGVVIIPNMIKGGFVVGVRHGRGVVMVRNEKRVWESPQFVTMTGGSVGWQAGVQATDVILVFHTKKSVEGLLSGKFTVGVDASAAAGPVGRQASAGTDLKLQSEIYSYSRSRGLFVGASVDGSSLQVDQAANQRFYSTQAVGPNGQIAPTVQVVPESAVALWQTLVGYADKPQQPAMVTTGTPTPAGQPTPAELPPRQAEDANQVRKQLAAASIQLGKLLDDQWKNYLALPQQVYQDGTHADLKSLEGVLVRFDQVATNANYAALNQRAEYQQVHGLLINYYETLSAASTNSSINLPPPPGAANPTNSGTQGATPLITLP